MAQRHGGTLASFDALPPELQDCIVKLITVDKPAALQKLARVSRAFLEATRRCSRKLVLPKLTKNKLVNVDETKEVCAALMGEIGLRPLVSKLLIWREVEPSLWAILNQVQWAEVVVNIDGASLFGGVYGNERWEDSYENGQSIGALLSASKDTLKKLEVDLGRHYPHSLTSHVLEVAHSFPGLKTLTFQGGKAGLHKEGAQWRVMKSGVSSSLAHLDIVSFKFTDWSEAVQKGLPDDLTSLTSLRFHCTTRKQMLYTPEKFPGMHQVLRRLRNLNMDVWADFVRPSMLEEIAESCPALRSLVIHVNPNAKNCQTYWPMQAYHGAQQFAVLLDTCLELEQVAISQTQVVIPCHFYERVDHDALMPGDCVGAGLEVVGGRLRSSADPNWGSVALWELFGNPPESLKEALRNKLRVSGDDYSNEVKVTKKRLYSGTKVLLFQLLVPLSFARWDRRDNPAIIRQRMLGEASEIEAWVQTFCN